jgi:hypothetical protein
MKTKFIEQIYFPLNLQLMLEELEHIETSVAWPEQRFSKNGRDYHSNQIGLTHRPGAEFPWYDANGSLYDKSNSVFLAKEGDFTIWNSVGSYTKKVIDSLAEQYSLRFGRIRYMRLLPKTGLSIHADAEPRYHLALRTTPKALFFDCTPKDDVMATGYHIPADGCFYKVDTTREHTVFNGGWEPRVHLVLSDITC